MHGGLVAVGENARAFQDDINMAPWQFSGVANGGDLNWATTHVNGRLGCFHFGGKAAMHAVKTQKMRVGVNGPQIIDCDHLNIGAARLDDRAQHVASNPTKPINGNFNSHNPLQCAKHGIVSGNSCGWYSPLAAKRKGDLYRQNAILSRIWIKSLPRKTRPAASRKRKSTAMTQRIKTPSQIAIVFVIKIKSKQISGR